jgi:membrane AbrB-like protein
LRGARDTTVWWLGLGAVTNVAAVGASAVGVPSAALFAALLVGIAYALTLAGRHPLAPPEPINRGAQAVVGVALGAAVDADTLRAVGSDWLPVLLVTAGTLAASLGAGVLMARVTRADAPTASLGLIAGGASGIVAMADELGADARMVAFMQYLRVLAVVLLAPPLAHLVTTGGGHGGPPGGGGAGLAADLAFTAGCAVGGVVLARITRLTGGSVLVPLMVAAALSISGLSGGAAAPDVVEQVAFALIGLQVGLRFTVASLREARDLLPATIVSIIGLIVACAAMAAGMAPLAGVSYADAYLATTPGGLYAVLAAAADLGANTTFVVAVQALRVFVMVLAAPPLVRLLVARDPVRRPG